MTATLGGWPLQRPMTEVVGSGHESADEMTCDRARETPARIPADGPARTELGAFLLASRRRRTTAAEPAAHADIVSEGGAAEGLAALRAF